MIISIACLGAIMNKIRGGLLADLYAKHLIKQSYEWTDAVHKAERYFKTLGKQSHLIVFATVFTFIVPVTINPNWHDVVILYIAMLAGQSVGWGQYINGMINKKSTGIAEVEIIDSITIDAFPNHPVFANTLALSLRGLLWSFCVSLGFSAVIMTHLANPKSIEYIAPTGLMMGLLYLFAMELCQRLKGFSRGNGWQFGEYFTGFFFWGSWAYFLGA